jgi:hypothetical protein
MSAALTVFQPVSDPSRSLRDAHRGSVRRQRHGCKPDSIGTCSWDWQRLLCCPAQPRQTGLSRASSMMPTSLTIHPHPSTQAAQSNCPANRLNLRVSSSRRTPSLPITHPRTELRPPGRSRGYGGLVADAVIKGVRERSDRKTLLSVVLRRTLSTAPPVASDFDYADAGLATVVTAGDDSCRTTSVQPYTNSDPPEPISQAAKAT